jgi:nicotinamide-nucleotide amidase
MKHGLRFQGHARQGGNQDALPPQGKARRGPDRVVEDLGALRNAPLEAETMFHAAVLPLLSAGGRRVPTLRLERRLLHTFGLPEAEVDQRLRGVLPAGSGIRLGFLAAPLGVMVSLTRWTQAGRKGRDPMAQVHAAVRRRLGRHVYAEGKDSMEQVIGRLLTERNETLAVAESCTGGLIGHRLTQVPGSSAYVDRVAVVYSNQAKHEWLGVPQPLLKKYGAVSAPVAAAMARGIRKAGRTTIGLSVTGIAGPGGGSEKKPVGLVYVGLAAGKTAKPVTRTAAFRFHGSREVIKLRASQAALDLLRRWLEQARS